MHVHALTLTIIQYDPALHSLRISMHESDAEQGYTNDQFCRMVFKASATVVWDPHSLIQFRSLGAEQQLLVVIAASCDT